MPSLANSIYPLSFCQENMGLICFSGVKKDISCAPAIVNRQRSIQLSMVMVTTSAGIESEQQQSIAPP